MELVLKIYSVLFALALYISFLFVPIGIFYIIKLYKAKEEIEKNKYKRKIKIFFGLPMIIFIIAIFFPFLAGVYEGINNNINK